MHIAQIATGEVEDAVVDDGKDPNAKALGAKGGKARAANLSPERKGTLRDPYGHIWLLATRKENVSFEEIKLRFDKMMRGEGEAS